MLNVNRNCYKGCHNGWMWVPERRKWVHCDYCGSGEGKHMKCHRKCGCRDCVRRRNRERGCVRERCVDIEHRNAVRCVSRRNMVKGDKCWCDGCVNENGGNWECFDEDRFRHW